MQMTLTLTLPRDQLSVPVMRGVLRGSLVSLGVTADCVTDISIALTEACTNVLLHAEDGDEYEVAAKITDATCRIEVIDTGRGFDLEEVDSRLAATEEPTSEHGRGLRLMQALVDTIHFENDPLTGHTVKMEKRLSLELDAPLRRLLSEQRVLAR